MLSISRSNSLVLHSPILEVNPFHVIFDLNGVLVATHFNKSRYGEPASQTVVFKLRLKEFSERCVAQFHVYIWFATQRHNIYNYLDQIWHETQILIEPSRVFNQTFCMQNSHFLPNKLEKPIFHKNLDVFFSMFPYTRTSNMLLINDTPYKNMFNNPYNAIFWEFFDIINCSTSLPCLNISNIPFSKNLLNL